MYCSPALKTVWAYSKKVTGIYESASPNKDLPTSVVVSGVTYKLEGVDAYNKLSSSGSFNYGDTVTLLLGRNGGAVSGKNITIGGGVGVITDGGNVKGFISTQQLAGQIKSISGGIVTTNAGEFKLDGNARAFIEASGYSYMQTTVSEVSDLTKYTVRAYYDKAEDKGGRIRVLVAALK